MISKTKYEASPAEIDRIFERAKLGKVLSAKSLGEGEFNAAYRVETEQGRYVLKIAPPKESTILTYERDMMHSEVFWYEQIRKHTTVTTVIMTAATMQAAVRIRQIQPSKLRRPEILLMMHSGSYCLLWHPSQDLPDLLKFLQSEKGRTLSNL